MKGSCALHKIEDVAEFTESGVKGKICIHALYSMMPAVFAMLFDALLIYGKNHHPVTTLFMAVVGGFLSILFTIIGYAHFYLAIIVFITILLYIYVFLTREKILNEHEKK